mmetsp:Transcript_11257/g.34454  ORF Transcript_11257/g.34454 Transcript_11257/m.34454 type:complete len:145 (+) Transcript_11257:183-617(+)
MASFAIAGAAGVLGAAGVVLKGAVEVQTVFKWENNVLARQGEGMGMGVPSQDLTLQRQKAGGIKGANSNEGPSYANKVPKRSVQGDIRANYLTPKGNSFTNNTSTLDDILAKVPNKGTYGTPEYRQIARPRPKETSISNRSYIG